MRNVGDIVEFGPHTLYRGRRGQIKKMLIRPPSMGGNVYTIQIGLESSKGLLPMGPVVNVTSSYLV